MATTRAAAASQNDERMRAAVPPIAFDPHDLGPQSPETSSDVVDSLTPALMRVNLDKKRGADDLRVSFDRSSDEDGPRSNRSGDSKRSSLGQTPVGIKQLKNSPTVFIFYSSAVLESWVRPRHGSETSGKRDAVSCFGCRERRVKGIAGRSARKFVQVPVG